MSSVTAHILIGYAHQNQGGIIPTHSLFLSENSRPAWVLDKLGFSGDKKPSQGFVWTPTLENILEDAILMIAIYVLKDEEITALAKSFCKKPLSKSLELYEDFEPGQLKQLYKMCRQLKAFPMLVVSVLQQSTIEKQLPIIKKYTMDVEVCRSTFVRFFSAWTGKVRIEGSLKPAC